MQPHERTPGKWLKNVARSVEGVPNPHQSGLHRGLQSALLAAQKKSAGVATGAFSGRLFCGDQ
jgi:hypothetical protein